MDELESIKTRLLKLEAQREGLEDWVHSLEKMLVATLKIQHMKGGTKMQDVAAEMQSHAAFSQAAHDVPPPQRVALLVVHLRTMGEGIDQARG